MNGYFVAPDAYDEFWVWRENGDRPIPVLARFHLDEDPELWERIIRDMPVHGATPSDERRV